MYNLSMVNRRLSALVLDERFIMKFYDDHKQPQREVVLHRGTKAISCYFSLPWNNNRHGRETLTLESLIPNNDNVISEINWLNGCRHGPSIRYLTSPPHTKFTETNYAYGKRNGKFACWFQDGRLQQIGEYLNDQQSGIWKVWEFSGQLREMSVFENGIKARSYRKPF
eukprot:TRINITY_DN10517_c0_g1_i1.p1 TRINITY_DN10517_c0_g1~~TRINITY_DN10517_c0_g1_i1.p1  ORF type:complete len:168 (-),score=3.56 TRINITY_DN10517_c0_g1_i1:8-511(-)